MIGSNISNQSFKSRGNSYLKMQWLKIFQKWWKTLRFKKPNKSKKVKWKEIHHWILQNAKKSSAIACWEGKEISFKEQQLDWLLTSQQQQWETDTKRKLLSTKHLIAGGKNLLHTRANGGKFQSNKRTQKYVISLKKKLKWQIN